MAIAASAHPKNPLIPFQGSRVAMTEVIARQSGVLAITKFGCRTGKKYKGAAAEGAPAKAFWTVILDKGQRGNICFSNHSTRVRIIDPAVAAAQRDGAPVRPALESDTNLDVFQRAGQGRIGYGMPGLVNAERGNGPAGDEIRS
jgi:hypothetical protein